MKTAYNYWLYEIEWAKIVINSQSPLASGMAKPHPLKNLKEINIQTQIKDTNFKTIDF